MYLSKRIHCADWSRCYRSSLDARRPVPTGGQLRSRALERKAVDSLDGPLDCIGAEFTQLDGQIYWLAVERPQLRVRCHFRLVLLHLSLADLKPSSVRLALELSSGQLGSELETTLSWVIDERACCD